MKIRDDVIYVGVNDKKIDLFEGQYIVPEGMAYNSYVIVDEKCAVLDTVSQGFGEVWLEQVKNALNGKKADYLVVHHMEPDHSANIATFMKIYPQATLVANNKAFVMIQNFFGDDYADRRLVVGEGDTLCLGRHTLTFVMAPMVHWPE
ncbi:MAG: MBL fold metallo-hydrolase, partial [Clostridia bacterium]|nr:MBL fold metallo-hydrolase [Clostridia bacterium]